MYLQHPTVYLDARDLNSGAGLITLNLWAEEEQTVKECKGHCPLSDAFIILEIFLLRNLLFLLEEVGCR